MEKLKTEILLIEYQKAQDSAEHHDRLLWAVVGLLVTGMAALLVVQPGKTACVYRWTRFYPPILGIIASFVLFYFVRSLRFFKNEKYKRCKVIERLLGMEQHSKLQSPKLRQVCVVYVLSGISLFVWICRLCGELHRGCP